MQPSTFKAAAQSVMLLVAVLASVVLIMLARQPWREMSDDAPAPHGTPANPA